MSLISYISGRGSLRCSLSLECSAFVERVSVRLAIALVVRAAVGVRAADRAKAIGVWCVALVPGGDGEGDDEEEEEEEREVCPQPTKTPSGQSNRGLELHIRRNSDQHLRPPPGS